MRRRIRKRKTQLYPSSPMLSKKVRKVLEVARTVADSFDNKMFAEMYIYAVEQHAIGQNPEYLKFIEQLREPPVDIETFLDSEDFMGATDLVLWPEVRRTIINANKEWWKGWDIAKNELLLMGATGTGKSEISKVSTAYHLHILGCMKKPQRYWGLPEATSIVMTIQAAKPHVTKKIVYLPLRTYIETMPWFQRHMRPDKILEGEMYFPDHNVRVVQGGADSDAVLGDALIGGVTDEINFMNVVEHSKKAGLGTGRSGSYDQAQAVYDTITRRKKSRFLCKGPNVGVFCIASSTRYKNDFTDRRLQQVEAMQDQTVYVYNKAQYEVRPSEKYCGDTFRLLVANEASMDIRILEDDEKVLGGTVIEVPVEYEEDFRKDAAGAMRDIVGRSVNSINPFFRQQAKIMYCIDKGEEAGVKSFLHKDNVVLGFESLPMPITGHYCSNPSKPRYVHIDLSNTGDRCGVAMVRYDGIEWVERTGGEPEALPIATVEMAVTFEPDHGHEIDIAEVRSWVRMLRSQYGYPIRAVTYDGWNCVSTSSMVWTGRGLIPAGTVEVGDLVQTRSGAEEVEKVWNYGNADTLVVRTQHGHSLEMTAKHKIQALDRWEYIDGVRSPKWVWVRADNLIEGQVVRIWDQEAQVDPDEYQRLRRVAEAGNNKYYKDNLKLTEEVAEAIGLLHGDGSFGDTYFTITCHEDEKAEAEDILMKAFDFESKITWRQKDDSKGWTAQVTNTAFMLFLRTNGLANKHQIPPAIMHSPLSVQSAFISGLLAADGSVKDRDGQVSIETVSDEYSRYLMNILPMFGLGCNLSVRTDRTVTLPQGGTTTVNSFIVSIRGSRQEFLDRIGIAYKSKERIVEAHSSVPGRFIFSKVESIKHSSSDVVDFQIAKDHSYVVNGFVSHNSLESRQAWKKQGMKTGLVSVDRTSAPYKQLRDALYDGRILMYNQPVLIEELFSLEYDEKKDKVDHPITGSKDCADAVCGAYHTLLTRSSSWVMPDGGGDPNQQDRVDMGDRFEVERPG